MKAIRNFVRWWKRKSGHKYINGGNGVISIFLALLMIPFATFADFLVESARYQSAVTLLDESMDSASLSVLADYDSYLLDRFGLLAVSNDADIAGDYESYLNSNIESLKAWNLQSVDASGTFDLSDTDTLLKQIEEFSQYSVPTTLVGDFALSDLISTLEKATGWNVVFEAVSSAGNLADNYLTYAKDLVKLQEQINKFETDQAAYTSKHQEFKSAYETLNTKIAERDAQKAEVDRIQNEINQSTEVSDCSSALTSLEARRDEIAELLEDDTLTDEEKETLEEELTDLNKTQIPAAQKALTEAQAALQTLQNELTQAKTILAEKESAVTSAKSTLQTKASEYTSLIDTVVSDLTNYETLAQKALSDVDSIVDSGVDFAAKMEAADSTDTTDSLKEKKSQLEEKQKNATTDEEKQSYADSIKEIDDQISEVDAANKNVKNISSATTSGVNTIQEEIEDLELFYDEGTIDYYLISLASNKSLVNSLCEELDSISSTYTESYYYTTMSDGLIPSNVIGAMISEMEEELSKTSFWDVMQGIVEAVNSLFATDIIYDAELNAYIANDCSYTSGEIDAILQDISDLVSYFEGTTNAITGLVNLVTHLVDIINTIKDLVTDLVAYLTGIASRALTSVSELISDQAGEKILLSQYLTKTLANRRTFESGKNTLTGYSFKNIEFADTSAVNAVPAVGTITALVGLLQDVSSGGNDYMFCGAEMEYILIGSRSEIINQSAVFLQLYFARMLLDIIPIASNAEVQAIADSAGAVTLGIGALGVYVGYFLVEPLIEAILITNGEKINAWKTVVYLTPSGIATLVGHLTKLGLDNSKKESLKESAEKVTGTTAGEDVNTNDANGFKLDYSQYLFLLSLLFSDMDTSLERFQTLIVLESTQYYRKSYNNISYTFDLSKTYTCIQADVKGTFDPILPLGGMAVSGFTDQNRSRMRGY